MTRSGTNTQVLGIDPGAGGALVHIGSHGYPERIWRMPKKKGKIDFLAVEGILRSLHSMGRFECAIEKMQPFGSIQGASQVMMNYGVYIHLLRDRVGMPFTEYYIATWKAAYGLSKKRGEQDEFSDLPKEEQFTSRQAFNKAKALVVANTLFKGQAARFGKEWTADVAEASLIGLLHRGKIIQRGWTEEDDERAF